jgi:hypothetical protein
MSGRLDLEPFWSGEISTKTHAERICRYVGNTSIVFGLVGIVGGLIHEIWPDGRHYVGLAIVGLLLFLPGLFLRNYYSVSAARVLAAISVIWVVGSLAGTVFFAIRHVPAASAIAMPLVVWVPAMIATLRANSAAIRLRGLARQQSTAKTAA